MIKRKKILKKIKNEISENYLTNLIVIRGSEEEKRRINENKKNVRRNGTEKMGV